MSGLSTLCSMHEAANTSVCVCVCVCVLVCVYHPSSVHWPCCLFVAQCALASCTWVPQCALVLVQSHVRVHARQRAASHRGEQWQVAGGDFVSRAVDHAAAYAGLNLPMGIPGTRSAGEDMAG